MTIKDIARESGYSLGTVSRCLNNQPGVSETAREKILAVTEKYNFRLNTSARSLKSRGGTDIAVLVKGMSNMLFASIVEQLQGNIKQKGYPVKVYYFDEDVNEVEYARQICTEDRVGGILFLGSNTDYFREGFSGIQVPCVLVTNSAEDLGFEKLSSVSTDDREAAMFAIEHLINLGHKNIGILSGDLKASDPAESRMEGCKAALQRHGIDPDTVPCEETYYSSSDGYHAMQRMLRQHPDITAVFAMSDVMAIGAIRAIRDAGKSVPEDISVIGFDGLELGNYLIPRLTTVRQHAERIALRSVEILTDNMEGMAQSIHEIEPFHLVPGESVRSITVE